MAKEVYEEPQAEVVVMEAQNTLLQTSGEKFGNGGSWN